MFLEGEVLEKEDKKKQDVKKKRTLEKILQKSLLVWSDYDWQLEYYRIPKLF
jgi:hypothetical protein